MRLKASAPHACMSFLIILTCTLLYSLLNLLPHFTHLAPGVLVVPSPILQVQEGPKLRTLSGFYPDPWIRAVIRN